MIMNCFYGKNFLSILLVLLLSLVVVSVFVSVLISADESVDVAVKKGDDDDHHAQHAAADAQRKKPLFDVNNIMFGHNIYNDYFLLNYTNFNHGSFGSCPQPVLQYQSDLRKQQEQQPDIFLRNSYKRLWNETRVKIAQQLSIPNYKQLVLIESASTAINSLLRSIDYQKDVRTKWIAYSVCVCRWVFYITC